MSLLTFVCSAFMNPHLTASSKAKKNATASCDESTVESNSSKVVFNLLSTILRRSSIASCKFGSSLSICENP